MCFIPHQDLFMRLFFHPTSNGFFWWISRYGGYDGNLTSHILLSQRRDPKEKQVISLDQDVQVCRYLFWWMVDETPLYDFSLPCNIFGMGYISFFFFFLSCLGGMWHTFFGYASFISFCIAHTS